MHKTASFSSNIKDPTSTILSYSSHIQKQHQFEKCSKNSNSKFHLKSFSNIHKDLFVHLQLIPHHFPLTFDHLYQFQILLFSKLPQSSPAKSHVLKLRQVSHWLLRVLDSGGRGAGTLLIFFWAALQLFCYCMLAEAQDCCQEALCRTDGSFHRERPSLANTEITTSAEEKNSRAYLQKQDSQPTLPELPPYSSRTLDFEQNQTASPIELQVEELMNRFSSIHNMLISHSQQQSAMHEKRRGFRVMPIDRQQLTPDYANKVSIISDIVALVENFQVQSHSQNIQEILQTKFLEYYLQRHYGGLAYECNNLSIQERLEEEEERQNGLVISKLEGCDSVVRESAVFIDQRCGNDEEEECECSNEGSHEYNRNECVEIQVERVKIIQVEIPVVIFKMKEVVVRYEESDLCSQVNNIDSIINRYSKPYSDIYKAKQHQSPLPNELPLIEQPSPCETTPHTPAQSNIIASIMIDSNHHNLRPKETQIQLVYSDFPEEHNFKLPLDSYAQIESLISHQDGSSTGRLSRPPTERDSLIPLNDEAIMITQKAFGRSLLEKFEQNEKILNEENMQLKEVISVLQEQIVTLQKKNKQLEMQNSKLSNRLEEEIQQTEYLSAKLDEINAEILEEKVECLTHLNTTKERKIQALMHDLDEKNSKISQLTQQLSQIEQAFQISNEQLVKKDEEIQLLARQLIEKEIEVRQLQNCEDNVIEIAVTSEESLKKEIQRLQIEKVQLNEQIKQYKKRMRVEGISLLYDQAAEIKGIIQSRQHTFKLELLDVNKRYQEVINMYQEELQQIKIQLTEIKDINHAKTQMLASKDAKELLAKMRNQKYFREFEQIIKEYDRELEQKDEEILSLRMKVLPDQDMTLILTRFTSTLNLLENQLSRQRAEKAKMTSKFIELDDIVRRELTKHKNNDNDAEERLIQQLSTELQKKMNQNKLIKQKLSQQSTIIANFLQNKGNTKAASSIKKENDKLKDINRKLKQYTLILEQQIKAVCKIDQCESHRTCVNSLIQQKNYFCQLLTRQSMIHIEASRCF